MKIAYLFSGHSRTWELCHESFFENIYNVCPGDIFIHIWDRVNCYTSSWWNGWNEQLPKHLLSLSSVAPDFNKIRQMYKPIDMIIDQDPSWETPQHQWAKEKYAHHYRINHPQANSRFGAKYILYAFKKIFDVAKQYDNYDRMFCSRIDIQFKSKLNLEELNRSELILSRTKFSSPSFRQDIFFHGSVNHVDIRSKLYDHIDQYWYNQDFIKMEFEHALTNYLKDYNVPCDESDIKFVIPRINGVVNNFL